MKFIKNNNLNKENLVGSKLGLFVLVFVMIIISSMGALGAVGTYSLDIDLLNQNPDPVSAGQIVELRLSIENNGDSTIDNLELELIPEYPFQILDDESSMIEVGTIPANLNGENVKIEKVKVRVNDDAPSGVYELPIKYSFSNSDSYVIEKISVEVNNNDFVEISSIDQTVLVPGQETELNFEIKNVGGSTLRDLEFSWTSEDKVILPVGSDNRKFIDVLEAGQSIKIPYKVVADTSANSGLYQVDLNLEYTNVLTGGNDVVTTFAGLVIGGETDFVLSYSSDAGNEISFAIANIGNNPAYSVIVEAESQGPLKFIGSNVQMIGNLNDGDYTVVSYTYSGAAQSDVEFNVEYTDTQGNRNTIEKVVSLGDSSSGLGMSSELKSGDASQDGIKSRNGMVRPNKDGISQVLTVARNIVIAIVLFVVGLFIYKRKKKNKKSSRK